MTDTMIQTAQRKAETVQTQGGLEVISIAKSYDKRGPDRHFAVRRQG